jgi:Domain of unknown function (DUF4157)
VQIRPLNQQELQSLSPFFDAQLLQYARIVDGRVPWWLHPNMCAVVLGKVIYFRKNAYQANTAQGLSLLAHELTHVKQYLSGMRWWHYIWSCRRGYRQSPYEQEAYDMGNKVLQYFTTRD